MNREEVIRILKESISISISTWDHRKGPCLEVAISIDGDEVCSDYIPINDLKALIGE